MKSYIFTLFFIFISTVGAEAQKLSHQVLVPAAGLMTTGNVSYQQTVGETAVEIFTLYPYTLTQGFQQPRMIPGDGPDPGVNGIDVYPNPVSKDNYNVLKVSLKSTEVRVFTIFIFNFSGSIVYSWRSDVSLDQSYIHSVDMSNFSRGIYIVRVMSSDGVIDLSYKIEKL
jgi:hypothetical protein